MMPAGRPSKYKLEYCDMLIQHMSEGLSFESFGGIVDVCKDTLYEWARNHKEFSYAKKTARSKCLLFWERLGKAGTVGLKQLKNKDGSVTDLKGFNAAMWIYNMKCRFREEWHDSLSIENAEDKPFKLAYDPTKPLVGNTDD